MDENQTQTQTATPPAVRRLVRRTDRKMIGGVCAGLGDYFGVDTVWFRVGFVVVAVMGGAGLVGYLALWVLMPSQEDAVRPGLEHQAERLERAARRTPAWVGVALVVLGVIVALAQLFEGRPGLLWGLGLVALGILLFRQHDARPSRAVPPSLDARAEPVEGEPPSAPPPLPPPVVYAAPSPPRRRRERSRLGWLTLGAILVVLGGIGSLDLADVISVYLAQYLAIALAVIGLGLVVGARVGRARWLIVPGLLLIPLVLVASLIRVPLTGEWGYRYEAPRDVAALADVYRVAGGDLVLDLRKTTFGDEPVRIVATVATGTLSVWVPVGVGVRARGRVGAGEVKLFGHYDGGVNVDETRSVGGAEPLVVLDLEVSLGMVEVRTA